MDLPKSIVKEFAKQAVEKKPTIDKPTQLVGTVQVEDGQTFVYLDGSNGSKTPVSETVAYQSGDRVLVSIQNRKATIIGNYTGPSINQALDNVIVEYALSSSSVSFIAWPGEKGEWNTIAPEKEDGSYMWQRTTKISTNPLVDPEISLTCIQGSDGKNGYTPYIGSNGNWWINGVDTGYSAEGDDGHSPYVDTTTNTWWEWGADIGGYHDTGIVPQGPGVFKSIVFKRFSSQPDTPTGGSYLSPVPSGWSDGIPSGTEKIWMSTRVFTSNGKSPQTSEWTTPQMVSDTPDIDFEYSWIVTNPGNPTDNPDNWSNAATENSIWMAVRKKNMGTWSSWEINKIKGEDGADGYSPTVTTGTSSDGSTTVTVTNKDGSNTTKLVDGKARADIDNLEIGGRNLLLNSGFKDNADEWFTYGITDYIVKDGKQCAHMNFSVLKVSNFVRQSVLGKLEPDTQYTMSVWVLTENVVKGTTNFTCILYHDGYYDNNGSSNWYSYGSKDLPLNAGKWTHVEWTFTTDSTKLLNSTVSDMYIYARDMTGDIYFCDLKFEKGNKATDWTPAPEDVQAEIDSIKKRVVIGDDSVDIVDSTGKLLASYGDAKIELGKNAVSSIIEMCGGMARVSARYGGLTTIYSSNGGYQTTLDYNFNETTFKSKVGSNYGSYEFIYSGGVWECSYSGNNAGYVQVNLSAYGITLNTTSVNEYASITINYWNGSEATFINADTTKPSRKLILGLAESGTSDNADYANIEIERSKEGSVEHSKINLLTVHDGANVAGVYLDNGNIELDASGAVLINQHNIVQMLIDMLCCADTESITVTAGTFTDNGCSATLVGNTLYLYFNAKAKAAITAGNIANQTMLTITFTDNRIEALYSVSGSGGASGPNSQMQFSASSNGGQHTITVTLAAIAQNIAKNGVINAHVSMPCVLNWDAYPY